MNYFLTGPQSVNDDILQKNEYLDLAQEVKKVKMTLSVVEAFGNVSKSLEARIYELED